MVGSTVGPYRIISKLGTGGMGEVFLGHDPRLQRRVALKRLTAAENSSGDVHARVLREARAAARLNHPHIAAVYDVLEQDGRAYIVMEYVDGESLSAKLARGPLPIDQVRDIGRQLASALSAAHEQGVIHRDLKPANIHVTPAGAIKLLDLGVAKLSAVRPHDTDAGTHDHPLEATLAGNPGTPIYMSPEQLFSHEIDGRSDIYSAGVVLFEMATGQRPYQANGAVALAFAMKSRPPAAASTVNPEVPRDLSDAIAKALEGDPARRFQSARELESALMPTAVGSSPSAASAAAGSMPAPSQDSPSSRWTRGWTTAAAVAVLLAVGTVAREPLMQRFGVRQSPPAPAPSRPIVLAILPIDNPTGEARAEYLGAGVASVLAENFGSIPGLTVLSRASTAAYEKKRTDLAGLQHDLSATFVLDLSLTSAMATPTMLARLYRSDGARLEWEEAVQGDAWSIETRILEGLGRALERSGLLQRGFTADEWRRIQKLPTTSRGALTQYSEARALIDRPDLAGNTARAIGLLQSAIATDPRFALAHAALADAYWRQYSADKDLALAARATDSLERALAIDPDRAPIYASLAMMQQQTGRRDAAIASLRHAIQLQPDSDDVHRMLGRLLAEKGQVDEGVAELNEAIRIRPRFWNNFYTLGYVLFNAGRYEAASDAYRTTTELAPNHAAAWGNLGLTEFIRGDVSQAIGHYEHAARLGGDAQAYSSLAFAYYSAKRYDDAIEAYRQSLRLNPKSVANNRNIGDVYARLGRAAEAYAAYLDAVRIGEQMLAVNPQDAPTIVEVAIAEAQLARRAQAERHAAEAVALAPANYNVRLRSAKVHLLLGQTGAALNDLALAIENGYERRMARLDEDLAPLRAHRRFQELVSTSADTQTKER